mmetsp:Transcript_11728/g.26236  ORF Transcript_11728/g.26236 Transcript_11728/m.26236 type:complete len:163 (-) Transcript_11728:137-625(-)
MRPVELFWSFEVVGPGVCPPPLTSMDQRGGPVNHTKIMILLALLSSHDLPVSGSLVRDPNGHVDLVCPVVDDCNDVVCLSRGRKTQRAVPTNSFQRRKSKTSSSFSKLSLLRYFYFASGAFCEAATSESSSSNPPSIAQTITHLLHWLWNDLWISQLFILRH